MNFIYSRKWQIILIVATSVILVGANFFWGFAKPVSAGPGYTFTAPGDFSLGNLTARAQPYTSSVSGNLTGSNAAGYTVTAVDSKPNNAGYMVSGNNILHNKFQIGNSAANVADSEIARTLLDISYAPASGVTVPLYISQLITFSDAVASQYRITITYTVTAK